MDTGWEGKGGMNWEIGIDMYTLMCMKWITNKNLLYKKILKKTKPDEQLGQNGIVEKHWTRSLENCVHSITHSLWVVSFMNFNLYLGNSVSSAIKWE